MNCEKPLNDLCSISSGNAFVSNTIIHNRKSWWNSFDSLMSNKWFIRSIICVFVCAPLCKISHWPVLIDSFNCEIIICKWKWKRKRIKSTHKIVRKLKWGKVCCWKTLRLSQDGAEVLEKLIFFWFCLLCDAEHSYGAYAAACTHKMVRQNIRWIKI